MFHQPCIPIRSIDWEAVANMPLTERQERKGKSYLGHRRGGPIAPGRRRPRAWKPYAATASPTRGWALVEPKRGREREDLFQACGAQCFLEPDSRGFPICARLDVPTLSHSPRSSSRAATKTKCFPVPEGVHAAYSRARQWKHEGVAQEALNILDHLCNVVPQPFLFGK